MEYLYIEETELIYTNINVALAPTVSLPYSRINTIFYGIHTRKLLGGLIKKQERHVTIRANGVDYVIPEHKVGAKTIERYTHEVIAFAKKYRVSLRETTGDSAIDYRL